MSEELNKNEYDEMDNVIILNDEEGKEVPFEVLDIIELDSEVYVVLLPVEEDEEADEVVILRKEDSESEDEEEYVSIEDEETLDKVFEIFKEECKDNFNFVD